MSIPEVHRQTAPASVRCAVVTVSDTRTPETDGGGRLIVERLTAAGHAVVDRQIVRDEPAPLRALLAQYRDRSERPRSEAARDASCGEESCGDAPYVDVVLLTGGTGLGSRDQTLETVSQLISKPLPGYGELFRMLSFAEIGAAAMLSRATGGLMGRVVLLTMPGSPAGVRLAMDRLILPELAHLVREARR